MKKRNLCVALLAAVPAITFATIGHAQSVDTLLKKLVDKGILTQEEANGLRAESTNAPAKSFADKISGASWVEKLNFGGDFRGRYDGIYQDGANTGAGSATQDRHRLRYRLRYGVTAVLTDHFDVGLR